MKILFVIPMPPPHGGITKWSQLVTEYLGKSRNVRYTIVNTSPANKSKTKFYNENILKRIMVQGIALFRIRHKIKKLFKQEKYDVLHLTTSGALSVFRDLLILRLAKRHAIPVIYHLHFGRLRDCVMANNWEGKLLKRAASQATLVIAMDPLTYQTIQTQMPNVQVDYLPNPIDVQDLPLASANKKKTVVYVGWMVKTKGIEELICAWNSVGKDFSEYQLRLVGPYTSEYYAKLKNMIRVPNVYFTGPLAHEDAMKELNNATVFVLPSYSEGFPNVILEAMALKTAIIATDVGAIREMLSGNGGILIPPKSVEDLETALRDTLTNFMYRDECKEVAYRRVVNEYEISVVMKKYVDMYRRLTDEKNIVSD